MMPFSSIRSRTVAFCVLLALASSRPGAQTAQPAAPAAPSPETTARLNQLAAAVFTRHESSPELIRSIQGLLADDPTLAEAHFLLGAAYAVQGSPDLLGEAKAEFQQALDLKPGLVQARVYLAQTYMQLGRTDQAGKEIATALEQAPGHPQLLTMQAEVERQAGHADKAVALANQVLAADPSQDQARFYRGLALLDLARPDDAAVDLERVAAGGVPQPEVYSTLAGIYLEANAPQKALAPLRRGIAIAPARPELHLLLARACRLTGALAEADAQLTLAEPSRESTEASGVYQQMQADLSAERGLLRLAQNRLPEAAQALQQAVALQPDHGPAHHGLAQALIRQGDYAGAATHAARAAELGAPLAPADLAAIRAHTPRKAR